MLLKKLLGACSLSLLVLAGCMHPQKPVTEVCVVDYFAQQGICGQSGQGANTTVTRESLHLLDRATCFKPAEWKKEKDYIDLLEAYVTELEKSCK